MAQDLSKIRTAHIRRESQSIIVLTEMSKWIIYVFTQNNIVLDIIHRSKFFFYYMRLLLRLQFILHETITDIYKSDYYWDQLTLMLMEFCPDLTLTNIQEMSTPHLWVREKTTFTQIN